MNKYILIIFANIFWGCISCNDKENINIDNPDINGDIQHTNVHIEDNGLSLLFNYEAGNGYTLDINYENENYILNRPVCVEVFARGMQESQWYKQNYDSISSDNEKVVCYAIIRTDAGSVINVTDTYKINSGEVSFNMDRELKVVNSNREDYAINSYFLISDKDNDTYDKYEYFIPSIMYKDNSNLSSGAIGSDLSQEWILSREERLPLPLAMLRHKDKGISISISDINSNPATFKGEQGLSHIVNENMSFGSLGFHLTQDNVELAYCYPGSEGEYTYADGTTVNQKRWAKRSHPVNINLVHNYTLNINIETSMDYPKAMKEHWRNSFNLYNPSTLEVNSEDIIKNSIEVLDYYYFEDNGNPGFPFSVHLPNGIVFEKSFAMGFVGMQPSCAYYLYRTGIEQNNNAYKEKGEKILDFWANKCLNEKGMPQVWWDISPWNSFRNENDLRNMQGGMEALIQAWAFAMKNGEKNKDKWKDCCVKAANWMLETQKPDGSWPMKFDRNGNIIDDNKFLSSNLIRFLAYMYVTTDDVKYKEAAIKAGDFCYEHIHIPYKYVGSVIDNPNVKDRESGQKAIEAFLVLYDLTGEKKWLDAACQAAYYTVTYMYAWNIPVEEGDEPIEWPLNKTSVGLTIIATGHSGADCGFSYNSFEYLRLYILTGNEDFLKIATLLEKNTKQTMDYDGTLGYALHGLQTEAIRIVTPRGYGVKLWLPWVTASALDPLFKMKDAYNEIGIDKISKHTISELGIMDKQFQKTQGLK